MTEDYREEKAREFCAFLGLKTDDCRLIAQALTHSSYANEVLNDPLASNQRLEFLGDAVLQLVVSQYLYERYPDFPEGTLTRLRAALVCEATLAAIAGKLQLGRYFFMGKGEEASGGRGRPSNLADGIEALLGALYLQGGLTAACNFIIPHLQPVLVKVLARGGLYGDYKTELQELVQKRGLGEVKYRILREEGPPHNRLFQAAVFIDDRQWGVGEGRSKKEAEQEAACQALRRLRGEEK